MKDVNTEIKQIPLKSGHTEIKRGGKRNGAGRKPLPQDQRRVSITIRLSRERFDRLCYLSKSSGFPKTKIISDAIGELRLSEEIRRRRAPRTGIPIFDMLFRGDNSARKGSRKGVPRGIENIETMKRATITREALP
jgi:hypothetical protein